MKVTENANADMVEVYNFNISKENKYASPTNFFKLITAANSFITVLKTEHPEVLDSKKAVSNYDRNMRRSFVYETWACLMLCVFTEKYRFYPNR